jgi:hypothetical protein
MLTQKETQDAITLAKKYKIGKLYVFGSASVQEPGRPEPEDYDFAIADYPPGSFFSFYADLSQKNAARSGFDRHRRQTISFQKACGRRGQAPL